MINRIFNFYDNFNNKNLNDILKETNDTLKKINNNLVILKNDIKEIVIIKSFYFR